MSKKEILTPRFQRKTTIDIVDKKKTDVATYIVHRLWEYFTTDDFINQYVNNWYKSSTDMKVWYAENIVNHKDWIISVEYYSEILDYIRATLPKKYVKKWDAFKPWFDNVMPLLDMIFWPKTFELAELEKNNTPNPQVNEQESAD